MQKIRLYNTLTREIETFEPHNDNKVKIYTCGLTVYSQPHIGNWVGYIYWDLLVNILNDAGYEVERVQNITDVGHLTSDDDSGEDKMEKGARREGLTAWDIAEKYIKIADHEAYDLLKLRRPDALVRATDYIDQQVKFVQKLEEKGFTYEIADEGIYFDTSKISNYGQLARLDVEGLQAGARVSVAGKRNITDFAVWKFSPKNSKRDMEWSSPWGTGFPGWHLECSVIAMQTLGEQLDIHTGGVDHIAVHHTNEIAQSEAISGKPFSKYWLHNNHLKVDGGKMSKSLGNIYTLEDIKSKIFDYMSFKLFVLTKHYQSEGNFTWENLEAAQNRLNSYKAMSAMRWQASDQGKIEAKDLERVKAAIRHALHENINTPEALAHLSELESILSSSGINTTAQADFRDFIEWLDSIFGLNLTAEEDVDEATKELLSKRSQARQNHDYETSDLLRGELQVKGISVRDAAFGQVWYRT